MAQQVDFSIPRHFLIIRQMIATRHVINDMTLSFPCRMFALFSLQVLLNGTMFERLRNAFVLPWRCDDETYSNDIKDGFKWKASYGEDDETMNAHFDFWYRQIFLNPMVEFRYTDVYGVAGFAKIVGPLYSFTHQLHGFLEYVDEATFHRLQELRHWSLFSYYDSDVVKHYCILWGTTCLLNHNDWAAGRFNVLNNELDAQESGFKLSYNYDEMIIDHGKCTSITDVLSLQVERVYDAFLAGEMEEHDDLYARINLMDRNYYGYRIHLFEVGEQIFVDYGKSDMSTI